MRATAVFALVLMAGLASAADFKLKIAHINDNHARFEPSST
jgi:hypothetical protein